MKEIAGQVKNLQLGDLVRVEWFDASIGKSLSGGLDGIDIPVQSWGVFLGVMGKRNKHLIIAQNSFRYADGVFDIDYTAVPLSWAVNVQVIQAQHIPPEEAKQLLNSFLIGGGRQFQKRIRQQRVKNHERMD